MDIALTGSEWVDIISLTPCSRVTKKETFIEGFSWKQMDGSAER